MEARIREFLDHIAERYGAREKVNGRVWSKYSE